MVYILCSTTKYMKKQQKKVTSKMLSQLNIVATDIAYINVKKKINSVLLYFYFINICYRIGSAVSANIWVKLNANIV